MESSSAIEIAKHTLMAGGILLAVGTLTGFLAQKIKVPDVALFLLVGILIGPAVLGLVNIPAGSAVSPRWTPAASSTAPAGARS